MQAEGESFRSTVEFHTFSFADRKVCEDLHVSLTQKHKYENMKYFRLSHAHKSVCFVLTCFYVQYFFTFELLFWSFSHPTCCCNIKKTLKMSLHSEMYNCKWWLVLAFYNLMWNFFWNECMYLWLVFVHEMSS